MKTKLLIIGFLLTWHLTDAQTLRTLSPQTLRTIELRTTDDQPFHIALNKPAVFIFLSPDCPLSKNYAPVLNDLSKKHPKLTFYGIFPGKAYSDEEIKQYKKDYAIDFQFLNDPLMQFARYLKAKVTPEVFLVNQAGHIIYSGLIDNWAVSLGKKRQVVTSRYLEEAISHFTSGKKITVTHTEPVGCLINDI